MTTLRSTLDFLLYNWLQAESLSARERFADHSRETFDAVLDTCKRIAREKYAPFNRTVDTQEPHFDGERVTLPQATKDAYDAYAASGMLSAAQDYDIGGMQLPYTVDAAANAFFAVASISISSSLLSVGNANLLMVHGTDVQKKVFALNEFSGRFSGTMCLSEPQAGSSLSDVATRAVPDEAPSVAADGSVPWDQEPLGPRYRLTGNKMWISSGEHDLSENIVHLVLAKIPGPDGKLVPGTRGISLFIVPKKLVDTEGNLTGVRNDVALAGLNHKLGWRGTTHTLLNFGEGKYPVEQFWRDNRLNMIHEGTHGIQALDLLGRKAVMQQGAAIALFGRTLQATVEQARARPALAPHAEALQAAWGEVLATLAVLTPLLRSDGDRALANASAFLEAFGHTVLAWTWLRQAVVADGALAQAATPQDADFYRGKLQACRWFFHWELPRTAPQHALLRSLDDSTLAMQDAWF